MNTRQRSFLVNLNRTLIFVLTVIGLLMDGMQLSDLPVSIALLVWLWLPLCTRVEAHLVRWLHSKGGHAGSAKFSPFV